MARVRYPDAEPPLEFSFDKTWVVLEDLAEDMCSNPNKDREYSTDAYFETGEERPDEFRDTLRDLIAS